MLGSEVSKVFADDEMFRITATHRDSWRAWSIYKGRPSNVELIDFDCDKDSLDKISDAPAQEYDYIINCIGVESAAPKNLIWVNSLFPHSLNYWAKGTNVIHISTDGVFSGKRGDYVEDDERDADDQYGKSKSAGEPRKGLVLRTSVIGEDKFSNKSLFSWVKSNKGKAIEGYTNHFWNGITARQYGKSCRKIILNGLYEEGAFHVFSPQKITKYELISLINHEFDLGIKISPKDGAEKVDRSLDTVKELNKELEIPPIQDQLKDLHYPK